MGVYIFITSIKHGNDVVESSEKADSKKISVGECLNKSGDASYTNLSSDIENYGLSMKINDDKQSITLSIDWSKWGPISTASAWADEVVDYQISGFSKNIKSVFVGSFGQDSSGITLLYLMKDGTVEYTPMFVQKTDSSSNTYYSMNYTYDYDENGKVTGEHFETKGKIAGVKNIVKFANASVSVSNTSGYMTVLAIRKDNDFYDLSNSIETEVVEETANKTEEDTVKDIDASKCLNSSNEYKNISDTEAKDGLSMIINTDKKSVTLSIDWSVFAKISNAFSAGTVENYQVTGFTKNVKSIFVGEMGQDYTGITLFYLMEDGTVEYTPMFVQKTDSSSNTYYSMNYTYDYDGSGKIIGEHFVTAGTMSGVDNVIKLYSASASVKNSSGYSTVLAAMSDGSFYDLSMAK